MSPNWPRRNRNVTWSGPNLCCRMRLRPTFDPPSRSGAFQRDSPAIRWKRSARTGIWSASQKNAPPVIHEMSPPMLKPNQAKPYLAFDFGAESGRAVLAHLQSGVLTTEEVHRFANEPVEYGESLHWEVPRLWLEVRKA